MNTLLVHADWLEYETQQETKLAEKIDEKRKKARIEECLVAFASFEESDEGKEPEIAKQWAAEIENVCSQVKAGKVVLYPYVHLLFGKKPSKPETALEIMKSAEQALGKKFAVTRVPFGYYKSFDVRCKGHPLSELSRVISGSAERKSKRPLKPFVVEKKKWSEFEKLRLTAALLAQHALKELRPEAKLGTLGLAGEEFYLDVQAPIKLGDFAEIEKRMRELSAKKPRVTQRTISKKVAEGMFKEEPFLLDALKDLPEKVPMAELGNWRTISFHDNAFQNDVSNVKHFRLLRASGAYWRGDSSQSMLSRVYGIAFDSEAALNEFDKLQAEAELCDHRKIGKQLELFSVQEEGPGFIFWHPKGTVLYNQLIDFSRAEHVKRGYQEIKTPMILSEELWHRSGHWDHYKENMYFTQIDGQGFAVKPMNCPGAILAYASQTHSYKELPLRLMEYGLDHRHELSGVLSGLSRVRAFTQDDAHIFIAPEQIREEVERVIELVDYFYAKVFGFQYKVALSTRPEKFLGAKTQWDSAEKSLNEALKAKKISFSVSEGDGAFYGPKIDFSIRDALGRHWQCATIQLDFQMPQRFNIEFADKDGKGKTPIIVHRVIYGSMERFIGILIEHYAGKFPLWLNPTQCKVVTISDNQSDYAKKAQEQLLEAGIRSELDERNETLQKKVRDAQLSHVNYVITIGDKEVQANSIAVRSRDGKVEFGLKLDEFIQRLQKEIAEKK